jgi:pimeloyl-ACP methyl ester carboxylesterase
MPSILLVPGTQATELLDDQGDVAYSASGLSVLSSLKPLLAARIGRHTTQEWADLLGLEYDAGSLDPAPDSVKLFPGKVLRTPYEPLYRKYGDDLTDWPYDWRFDITANGRLLVEWLTAHPSSAPDGKWRIVGHSQGGLVVLAAAAGAAPGEFDGLVSHACLVGAPMAGTFRAAEALLYGREDFGADADLVVMLRDAARSWPALVQMLPGWDAVVDGNDDPVPADLQLRHPTGWPADAPLTDAQAALLPREEVFHKTLLDYLAAPRGVELKVIMGLEQDTTLFIRRTSAGLPDSLKGQPEEPGDSLVPAFRTVRWADGRINGPVEFVKPNLPHAMLLKDPEVVGMVDAFFEGQPR